MLNGLFSFTHREIMQSPEKVIFIFLLSLSRYESLSSGPRSISSMIVSKVLFSRESHIYPASSAFAGPTPITPLTVFCVSSTRKRTALLNPSPSLIVTTVRTILKSFSKSRVLLITELIKNSLDSS